LSAARASQAAEKPAHGRVSHAAMLLADLSIGIFNPDIPERRRQNMQVTSKNR